MNDYTKKLTRAALLVILGCFVLNSVVLADLVKPPTVQYSIDSFSQQRVFQPLTTSALSTFTSEIQAKLRDYRSKSGSLVLNSYVKNSSTWLIKDIDQATAEGIAIAALKLHVIPLNFDDYQLSSVKLVNSHRGKEYLFEWTLKINEKQTKASLSASVDAKTGKVTNIGVRS